MPSMHNHHAHVLALSIHMCLRHRALQSGSRSMLLTMAVFAQADVDTDSVGFAVCQRAEALNVVAVVMAGRNRSRTGDFFLGSVTNFCTQHCRKPVLLVR